MNTEKQNLEELQKAMHGAIDALFALRDAADKMKKKPNYAKGGIAHAEPDPHDFCANAATAKTCKATAEQLAQRAKQEVHALKNLAVLEGDETADKKAGRIYDLIDQIVVCGVSEKRYGNSFIPDPNAQPLDLAVVAEIAQLRKENAELKSLVGELTERLGNPKPNGSHPNVDLENAARPLIKFMANNHHPHMKAIVTSTDIELVEGHSAVWKIHDFLAPND